MLGFVAFGTILVSGSCNDGRREAERRAHDEAMKQREAEMQREAAKRQEQEEGSKLQRRTFDLDVELRGPERHIKGHPTTLPEWADPLRDRIDPEKDDSWREKVAVRFEASCSEFVSALLDGDESAARSRVSDDFQGTHGLFPEFGEARFDDGSFAVHDHGIAETESEELAATTKRLGASDWSRATERQITATVVDLEVAGEGLWSCDLELRVVGQLDGVPSLMDAEGVALVREGTDGDAAPQLVSWDITHSRLIRRPRPTFQSISGAILEPLPHWQREFALGCGDYDRLADRRRINYGTGMLGMALGDVNGDGLEDLYVSMISGFPNRLFLHQPDGSLVDGAKDAGVDILDTTRGCLLVDLDADGDLELCIGRQTDLLIYWNDGEGKFTSPQALQGPGTSPIYSISAADPDLDGDLDLYCSRYRTGAGDAHVPTPYHNATNGAVNFYWRNDGERKFTEAGAETGLSSGDPRYSFIALWDDFDEDGRLDLYVVNDFGPNNLYIQTEDGFVDRAEEMGMLDASTGMGISGADVELDGDLDYYVTNMFSAPGLRSTSEPMYRGGDEAIRPLHRKLADGMSLLLQDEKGKYVEGAAAAGVDHGGWAWGALFYDWNLDGYPEIYVPNGFVTSDSEVDVETLFWRWIVATTPSESISDETYNRHWLAMSSFNRMEGFSYNGHERNHVYLNLGDGTYADVSPISDIDFVDDGRVAARADWDGDGLEDLILVNRTAPRLRIVRNTHPNAGHRVVIELHGMLGQVDAISARVHVERKDGKVVTQTVYAGEGLLGQSSHRRFFGLGENDDEVDVEVRWPDGAVQRFEGLEPDRGWKLYREGGRRESWEFKASPFASLPHSPAQPNPAGVQRVVLSDKMPLRYLAYEDASGRSVSLEELPSSSKLLTYWHPQSRSGLAFLKQLAEAQSEILEAGGVVVPVAFTGDGIDTGSDALQILGLAELALNAKSNDELILEALLVEVLSDFDSIPLPLSFLLDKQANLCAIYYGAPRTEEILEDLELMKGMRPDDNSTVALSGGHWIGRPMRRYRQIVRALMLLGARDLASDLKARKQ